MGEVMVGEGGEVGGGGEQVWVVGVEMQLTSHKTTCSVFKRCFIL